MLLYINKNKIKTQHISQESVKHQLFKKEDGNMFQYMLELQWNV